MTGTSLDARPSLPRRPQRPRRRRPVLRVLLALLLVLVVLVGISVGRALAAPGTDSTSARLAEWARGHGLSRVVDRLEQAAYQPPKVGGTPAADSPLRASVPPPPPVVDTSVLAPVVPAVSPPLPGEGVWRTVATTAAGRPSVQETFLRADATHTGYTAGVAWLDPQSVRFVLHPGTEEPGHAPWSVPPAITAAERPDLLAAFNGGFRLDAARGGYYEDGKTVGTLRPGAASLVIDSNGAASVGQWGRDVALGPSVVAVRQNLDLLVDGGQVVPGLDANNGGKWGATLGNKFYVWRSGVGQTATGALVYAAGDRLSASSLADLLHRAGAVRAMELDINPQWTSFVDYGPAGAKNLLPDMQRSPKRYDTTSTRDFIAVLRR